MRYKPSRFNYFTRAGEYILGINTFSRNLIRSRQVSEIQKNINAETLEGALTSSTSLQKLLIRDGFLVDKDFDEVLGAQYRQIRTRYSPQAVFVLLPTEQCNFRCEYCYESFGKQSMSTQARESFIKYLKKNIAAFQRVEVKWFGGEPLLALDVIDDLSSRILEICRKRGIAYTAEITTNGYLLTPEVMKQLLRCRVLNYHITLDGLAETHDRIRKLAGGKPTFEVIFRNLINIRDNIQSRTFRIAIRSNVTKDTVEHLDDYLRVMHREFANDDRFTFYFRPAGDWGGDRVKTIKNKLINDDPSLYLSIIENSDYPLNYLFYAYSLLSNQCYAKQLNEFVIGSDGELYKCTLHFDKEENRIGQLQQDGTVLLREDRLAKWVLMEQVLTSCHSCKSLPSCYGYSCPAENVLKSTKKCCGYESASKDAAMRLILKSDLAGLSHVYKNYDEEMQ